ncbi:MAG: cobalamin-dependent protein [Desulfobulbaceae bacterium]|jgi:5-methyltetrahydrofolate--homocysteine methyltransferase|nr:cobalamin-dependent protein [Desulfobulbaceae bacterium]MDH3541365.1 cobalamin-dependent protein [Desulfobulbaceae bacterium]
MILEKIAKTLSDLDKEETISLTVQAVLEGVTSKKIILHGLFPGLEEVAKRYGKKDHLYPDMYKASLIFSEALAKIKHQIISIETKTGVRGAIGLVQGDMQDFGKNIVHMTLETNGFDVKDLGKSVSAEEFLQAAREGADFIAISIMTDEGVEEAKKVVQELIDAGVREHVKIIVGGAGVNAQKAAEIIEADGYAEDAAEVVEFLKIFFQVEKDM